MQLVEIFRAGTHLDSAGVSRSFTEADLDQMASSYDPAKHAAPLLVGHDESRANMGLVDRVARIGSSLYAQARDVSAEFKAAVNQRRLPALSAALYHPDDQRNPSPGNWALRHVAAVQIPAVKGMAAPQFAEGDLSVAIEFSEPVFFSQPEVEPVTQTQTDTTALEQRETALAVREALIDKAEFANFTEALLKDGKQFSQDQAVAIFLGLPKTGTIAFSETEKPNPRDAFKAFLKGLPKTVEFAEKAGGSGPEVGTIDVHQIAAKAQKYKAEQAAIGIEIGYSEAVSAVMGAVK